MALFKKSNPRREKVRRNMASGRLSWFSRCFDPDVLVSVLFWLVFVALSTLVLISDLLFSGQIIGGGQPSYYW